MTGDEANAVLGYCAAADPRFNTADEAQAAARTQVWADLLAPVDAQFALDHVRRYYASHHDWPVTPGAIRTAWGNYQRVQESKARLAALPPGGVKRGELSEDAHTVVEQTREVIAAHQAHFESLPRHPRQLKHQAPAGE